MSPDSHRIACSILGDDYPFRNSSGISRTSDGSLSRTGYQISGVESVRDSATIWGAVSLVPASRIGIRGSKGASSSAVTGVKEV